MEGTLAANAVGEQVKLTLPLKLREDKPIFYLKLRCKALG
jgi:hypothetical protein